MGHPSYVFAAPQVCLPETYEQHKEAEEQNDAKPRMNCPRPLASAKQSREEEQARGKQSKTGNCQQHQTSRGDPMIHPGARRVSIHDDWIAGVDGVALFDVICSHD